ncbi:MAG: hypothetical protein EXR79_01160 [Myxococcales bacterium]|nr:hypothetical protein [Myxococcales bacterium]
MATATPASPAAAPATRSRTDAVVMLGATIGIAVVINALALQTSVRLDLTEQKIHTLSDASVAAAQALDNVAVTVYVSKKLPETIPTPQGKVPLRGIERSFRDKIDEYLRASGGHMSIAYADDNSPGVGTIEEQGEAAKLEPFSSTEAEVTGGQLKFARFVMGATFHYKTVHEVLPKALQPGFYEFEITKILLRLKEKHDNAELMKEPLAHGKALFEGVKACNEAVQKAAKVDEKEADTTAGLNLKAATDPTQKRLDALKLARPDLDKVCKPVGDLVTKEGGPLKGKNQFGDNLVQAANQFREAWDDLAQTVGPAGSAEPDKKAVMPPHIVVPQLVNVLEQLFREVDRAHQTLTDSPGRKQIGFLCGHDEFCPFGEAEPFVQEQLAMMMAQNNPMMKQIVQAATQIAQGIDETNGRIGDNLFTKRGYSIRRVDPGEPIGSDISALIVYAPRKAVSEYTKFQLDQFLLSGRAVVMLAQEWEVALMNMAASDDIGNDMRTDYTAMTATTSNLGDILKGWGIELKKEPILDSEHVDTVRVMQLVNRGGLQFQTQQDFPYGLIPVAVDFDRSHPLTRSLSNLALPYTTSLEVTTALRNDKRFEVVDVIKSSKTSVRKAPPIPVIPPALNELVKRTPPTGPHTLALYVRGPFPSLFAGKELPKRPKREDKGKDPMGMERPKDTDENVDNDWALAKRQFRAEGSGKLLVVASNLGIEGLSRATVLSGFDLSKLTQFSADTIKLYQQWQAGFQNWQIRIGQVSHLLGDNLQFLYNVLDWASSHEALVAIRSKGDTRRPLEQIENDDARRLRLGALLGAPLLLVGAGLARWRMRRRRDAALQV